MQSGWGADVEALTLIKRIDVTIKCAIHHTFFQTTHRSIALAIVLTRNTDNQLIRTSVIFFINQRIMHFREVL